MDTPIILRFPDRSIAWIIGVRFHNSLGASFIKKGSASIHPVLGGIILQIVAALLGALICGYLIFGLKETMFYDGKGITWAILAGLDV